MNDNNAVMEAISRSAALMNFDLEGVIISANEHFCRLLGYEEDELEGQHHRVLLDPRDADEHSLAAFWKRLRDGETIRCNVKRVAKDGRDVWLDATYTPVKGANGQPQSVLKIATNATLERQRASGFKDVVHALSRSNALLELSLDGNMIHANQLFLTILGYTSSDLIGRHHRMLVDPAEAAAPSYASFWERLQAGEFICAEFRRLAANGGEVWLQATYNPVFDAAGRPYKILKIATDITETVRQRRQAQMLATTDALTGLANRRAFDITLSREFWRAERSARPLSLVMIDIDNFKKFNDRKGHPCGDDCIVSVARIIESAARRAGDTAARYGGEEFVVILSETGESGAAHFAEFVRKEVERAGIMHEDNLPLGIVTISVGVASLTRSAGTPYQALPELLSNVDKALYAAKQAGRNRVVCRGSGPPDTVTEPEAGLQPIAGRTRIPEPVANGFAGVSGAG